jgi:hypothetical protein
LIRGTQAFGTHGQYFAIGAAVDAEVEARDHLRVVRSQEHGGPPIVARARKPARGHHLLEVEHRALAPLWSGPAPRDGALAGFLAVGRGRREAVHADPVLREIHGGGAGEVEQAALARAVANVAGLALMARRSTRSR